GYDLHEPGLRLWPLRRPYSLPAPGAQQAHFFSGAETSAAAFAGFSCNRPQPNKLPDANNTTTAISTTSRRPGTVDICVLLDKVRKRPSKVPSVPRFNHIVSLRLASTVCKCHSIVRPPNVRRFVIRLGSPI